MKHDSHPEIPAFATFYENVIGYSSTFPKGLKRTTQKLLVWNHRLKRRTLIQERNRIGVDGKFIMPNNFIVKPFQAQKPFLPLKGS
jgi:hypothetical protein